MPKRLAPVYAVGDRFGRLVVIDADPALRRWRKRAYRCRCDCGNETMLPASNLRQGNTRSCGCLSHDRKVERGTASARHRMIRTPTYWSWSGMVQRCTNPKSKCWHRYGGRGITVCSRWLIFANFLADMGEKPRGRRISIDRIDNDRDYEPGNCRWATNSEQSQNRSTTKLRREDVTAIRRGNDNTALAVAVARGITRQYARRLRRADGAHNWAGAA